MKQQLSIVTGGTVEEENCKKSCNCIDRVEGSSGRNLKEAKVSYFPLGGRETMTTMTEVLVVKGTRINKIDEGERDSNFRSGSRRKIIWTKWEANVLGIVQTSSNHREVCLFWQVYDVFLPKKIHEI